MGSRPSPRPGYRTARERVASRRGEPPAPRRRGCVTPGPVALLLLGLTAFLVGFLFFRTTRTLGTIEQNDPRHATAVQAAAAANTAVAELPNTLREPFTVLLIGVDQRDNPDEIPRGDTLIVVHVNPTERWASMLSIPRDTLVSIPNIGEDKINAAYFHGYIYASELYGEGTAPAEAGGALAAETVEAFLGVPIDYIAQVDFRGFQRIIDTIGGISIDVPQPLLDAEFPTANYGYERIYIPAGLQVLDGRQALIYARSRHAGSDFDRSSRQQQVLQAMLHSMRQRALLDQIGLLPELVADVQESVATTLPVSDLNTLRGLAALASELSSERIVRLSLNPNDVGMNEIGTNILWNPEDVQLQVNRLLAGP